MKVNHNMDYITLKFNNILRESKGESQHAKCKVQPTDNLNNIHKTYKRANVYKLQDGFLVIDWDFKGIYIYIYLSD